MSSVSRFMEWRNRVRVEMKYSGDVHLVTSGNAFIAAVNTFSGV